MPDWISAWAAVVAVIISMAAFVWGRIDHARAKRDAQAAEDRDRARLEQMERMATAAEQIALTGALPAQVAAAANQLRNAVRWRAQKVDSAPNRIVYELTNTSNDTAHGVTASAPDDYAYGMLLKKLPQNATFRAHESTRFYLEVRLVVVHLPALHVVWDGGDETIPVTGI